MDKAALRRQMGERVRALPPARRALEEELVVAAIQATPEWAAAGTVALYHRLPDEFSVVGLTLAAWRMGKSTLFPRVTAEGLALAPVTAWRELRPGRHGIAEPAAPAAAPGEVDLAIIPGRAFTPKGARLGRGGGHYDRLLPELAVAWGVAFDCQVVPALPLEGHDRPVAKVWYAAAVGLET